MGEFSYPKENSGSGSEASGATTGWAGVCAFGSQFCQSPPALTLGFLWARAGRAG